MKLTWLGHSAFRLDFGASVVLIDPFLTGNPSFTGNRADAIAGATHVLLTHGHSDPVGHPLPGRQPHLQHWPPHDPDGKSAPAVPTR